MSKYMQLRITIVPYYEKDFKNTYPKLARQLRYGKSDLAEPNPSLYDLVGQLDKLLYTFDGTPLRDALFPHREVLLNLHKKIEENIAHRNLAQVDQLLYKLEDVFDNIESELLP
ncbi:MAG: hypothetical protein FJ128_12155 [Deltaproteobacteria bacterium]|nr:hypothetical protein [Deltaproteobacteria bacterium]